MRKPQKIGKFLVKRKMSKLEQEEKKIGEINSYQGSQNSNQIACSADTAGQNHFTSEFKPNSHGKEDPSHRLAASEAQKRDYAALVISQSWNNASPQIGKKEKKKKEPEKNH